MQTRVEPYRGDLAVVVPTDLAARAGLRAGEAVEVELAGGRLVVGPPGGVTLAELVAQITPENLHVAWDDGPPVGRELL